MRLFFIGPSGSGKTFAAHAISAAQGIPAYSNDVTFKRARKDRRVQILIDHLHEPAWTYEGRCRQIGDVPFRRAELIVFLDWSETASILRTRQRRFRMMIAKRNYSLEAAKGCLNLRKQPHHQNRPGLWWRQLIDPDEPQSFAAKVLTMARRNDINRFVAKASDRGIRADELYAHFTEFQNLRPRHWALDN